MSSSAGKRKKSNPNPSLPESLLVSIFARSSRLYYPTLTLVSKSVQSLIASPELYRTRSSLGNTESCLYVYLTIGRDHTPRWYTLCKKPNPNISNDMSTINKKKKPCGYVLAAIQFPHSPRARPSSLVSVGSNIYSIGGWYHATSSVSILDCRSQTWLEAPSMQVERRRPATMVLDGKIYVAGSFEFNDCNSSNWMEVFDPKTQTWDYVSCPGVDMCAPIHMSAGIDGKLYMYGKYSGLAYTPKEGRSEMVGWERRRGWDVESYCVIENVIYSYHEGEFQWYDSMETCWKTVKGLPRITLYYPRLANYGGKLAFLWQNKLPSREDRRISCAVIALERWNAWIWGKVEWSEAVLTVPYPSRIDYALSATV